MDVPAVDGFPDTYIVDNKLFGTDDALATYLVAADRPAVLDAGTERSAGRILDALDEVGIDPLSVEYVLVSHVHLDHAAGTNQLLAACENATAVVHERGLPYLTGETKLDRLLESVEEAMGFPDPYGNPDVVPGDRCRAVSGGERLDLGDRVFDIVDAPGHAPHHYVAYDPDSGLLFAADAVGAYNEAVGVVPSTPPPSFDLEANHETIERIQELAVEQILFSHYGPGHDAAAELEEATAILDEWVETIDAVRSAVDDDIDAMVERLKPEWQSPTLRRDVIGVCQYLDRQDA